MDKRYLHVINRIETDINFLRRQQEAIIYKCFDIINLYEKEYLPDSPEIRENIKILKGELNQTLVAIKRCNYTTEKIKNKASKY